MSNKNIIFASAIGVGLICSLLHVFLCINVYDDIAAHYAPMARAFSLGDYGPALNPALPPLFPVMAGLISCLGVHSFTACMIVSGFFFVGGAVPMYWFAKFFLKRGDYAAWCSLIYILTPKVMRFGCSGLINPGRNTLLLVALVCLLYHYRKPGWKLIAGMGVALSALALLRGEGVAYIGFFGLCLLIIPFIQRARAEWKKSLLEALKYGSLLGMTTLILLSPRLAQVQRECGVPVLDFRQAWRADQLYQKYTGKKLNLSYPKGFRNRSWSDVEKHSLYSGKLLNCFIRGSYELYLVLGAVGILILVFIKKEKLNPCWWFPLAFVLFNAWLFSFNFITYRYFTINALLLIPLTFVTLEFIYDLSGYVKRLRLVVILGFAGIGIGQAVNGMEKVINRKYDYECYAGRWVAQIDPDGTGILASNQPQYAMWAERQGVILVQEKYKDTYINLPVSAHIKNGVEWFIIENDQKNLLELIKQSDQVKEVPNPFSKKLTVYRVKKTEK